MAHGTTRTVLGQGQERSIGITVSLSGLEAYDGIGRWTRMSDPTVALVLLDGLLAAGITDLMEARLSVERVIAEHDARTFGPRTGL